MRSKTKITLHQIVCYLVYVLLFANFPYISIYNSIKYFFIFVVGLYELKNISCIKGKRFAIYNTIMAVFCITTIAVSTLNLGVAVDRNPFLAAVVFCFTIMEGLLFAEITVKKNKTSVTIVSFYYTGLFLTLLTDLLLLFFPFLYDRYPGNYFIGTKFEVLYSHLFLIVLYICKSVVRKKAVKVVGLLLLTVLAIFVSIKTDCATGIVAIIILLALLFVCEIKIINRKLFFLGSLIFSTLFPFVCTFILVNSFVQNIILSLGRDLTLTTRTRIYPIVISKIPNLLYVGYGYGTTYELGMRFGQFADTQNCVLEWVWQIGLLGTIIMLLFFWRVICDSDKSHNKEVDIVLVLLYTLVLIGSIEITIEKMFFGLVFLVLMTSLNIVSVRRNQPLAAHRN